MKKKIVYEKSGESKVMTNRNTKPYCSCRYDGHIEPTVADMYPLLNSHLLWPPSCSVIAWIEDMLERDVNDNRKIGNYGAQHILSGVPRDSVTILTHCNTGSLATAGYGTALGETGALALNEKRRWLLKYLEHCNWYESVCRRGEKPPRAGQAEARVLHRDEAVQPGVQTDGVRGCSGGNPCHAYNRQHGSSHHEGDGHHRCVFVSHHVSFTSLKPHVFFFLRLPFCCFLPQLWWWVQTGWLLTVTQPTRSARTSWPSPLSTMGYLSMWRHPARRVTWVWRAGGTSSSKCAPPRNSLL